MTKIYRNKARNQQKTHAPYIPVYQKEGLEPGVIAARSIEHAKSQLTNHAPVVSYDNPRMRPAPSFQKSPEEQKVELSSLPNIGNNMETSWSSIDDYSEVYIEDDLGESFDPNHPLIDNNEEDPDNWQDIPAKLEKAPPVKNTYVDDNEEELKVEHITEQKASNSFDIAENEYVLIFNNDVVTRGAIDLVEKEVSAMVLGEHQLNSFYEITPDDIVVLKRVKLKVGVFLE